MTPLNGILPVDKPVGPTSHDIVAAARRALGIRRIGHTGTLDPFASGLLLLCIGPATRLAEYLTALPKSYSATLRLGVATDTDDSEGEIISSNEEWRGVERASLDAALATQTGDLLQVPAKYSAKKVAGERMYDVARRGGVVTLPPVPVSVHRLVVTRFEPPEVDFLVDCSSGTYVRAIARDVGAFLGVGAHLTALRRTRVGSFVVERAVRADELTVQDRVAEALLPPSAAVSHLPRVVVSEDDLKILGHGGPLPRAADVASGEVVALFDPVGTLLGIGEQLDDRLQPRKVFA